MSWVRIIVSGVLGLAAFSGVSRAYAADTGLEVGARIGYGIPLGKIADANGDDLSKGISGMIPLQLDVGYRVIPNLMVGAYVQYGFGFAGDTIKNECDAVKAQGIDASCSAHDVRLGIQGQFHILPGHTIDPWLGVGFGYEWLTLSETAAQGGLKATVSGSDHGFEFFTLQAGADYTLPVIGGLGVGPYASFSVGQYSKASVSCSGDCAGIPTGSNDITNKAVHEWLMFGVRGTFVVF